MTETIDTSSTTAKKRRFAKRLTIGVFAVVAFLFVLTQVGLDKALVKSKVDHYIEVMKQRGHEQNRDIEITYSDIEVVGGFTSRHAIIHDPKMVIRPLKPEPVQPGKDPKADNLVVTTPSVMLYPKSRDLSSLRVSLPEAINVAAEDAPEKSLLKIASSSPLDVTVAQSTERGVAYTSVGYTAPSSIDFTYLREKQAEGVEDATPNLVPVYDTMHVTFAPDSTIATKIANDDSNLGKADVNFKTITLAPQSAPTGVITIAGIETHWSSTLNDKNVSVVEQQVNIGPMTGAADVLPYAPIQLVVDATLEGMNAHAGAAAENPTITLKKLMLSTKDSTLTATANFTTNPADVMPVGSAHLNLTNIPFIRSELHKHEVLTPENEAWLADMMQKITGTPFDQLKDADIAIDRPKGGAFKIGNTTFEEMVAMVLQHALKIKHTDGTATPAIPQPATGGHAPVLPDKDKPKSKPIAIPDNGVRG